MNTQYVDKIFADTAYVRTGGSAEELAAAQYLQACVRELGAVATLEPFEVDMATVTTATLTVDGRDIPCKGYRLAGSGEVEAPLYYLTDSEKYSLACCRGALHTAKALCELAQRLGEQAHIDGERHDVAEGDGLFQHK